jgi:ring-1,2-phenylacetyl-CoA epoxidase subunit PaaE
MSLGAKMSARFHELEIAEVRRETADAVSLSFTVPKNLTEEFRFNAGQHLTLRADINGQDVRRNYSICVAPHEKELRVAIKAIPGGLFSNWASKNISAGQKLDVMVPHGSFTWVFSHDQTRSYVGFAGGSGITPILSLMKTALSTEPNSHFVLMYGNRSTESIMFLEEIAGLKDRYMNRLQIHHFLEDEEGDFDLLNGRLDSEKVADVLQSLIIPSDIDAAFICGPGPMMDAVEAGLRATGVTQSRILAERFTVGSLSAEQLASAKALEKEAAGRTMKITVNGRRRIISFDSRQGSILENARAAGLPAPFACKAGVCSTCRAKVIAGDVQMKQNYGLSAIEVEQGYVLTCQAIPMSDDVELNFDA